MKVLITFSNKFDIHPLLWTANTWPVINQLITLAALFTRRDAAASFNVVSAVCFEEALAAAAAADARIAADPTSARPLEGVPLSVRVDSSSHISELSLILM